MKLLMILPLFLVVTTALWGQTMAKTTNTNGILNTGSHHVMKRQIIAEAPNTACTSEKEGHVHPVPANSSLMWMCRNEEWKLFTFESALGYTSASPGKSCKHIRGTFIYEISDSSNRPYWVPVTTDSCSGEKQTMQVYCDMTTGEGGWHLVWKHSYLQVGRLTKDMYYHSQFHKPCTNLSVGWCNEANKTRLQREEMMIAAYHNGRIVYVYKGTFNRNIDHHWTGATLLAPVTRIVDYCTQSGTGVPTPGQDGDLTGLVFRKYPGGSTTITGSLYRPYSSRWSGCYLPKCLSSSTTNTQMTMAIYVR